MSIRRTPIFPVASPSTYPTASSAAGTGTGRKAELLTPGRPYEFTIEMYPTSLLFKRGHRIRLDISSSTFPRFDVNPNTGEPLNGNTQWRTATNTIYLDQRHASRITLPVIPPM